MNNGSLKIVAVKSRCYLMDNFDQLDDFAEDINLCLQVLWQFTFARKRWLCLYI